MVKHTQIIRRQQPTNCLSMFDHSLRLALKDLGISRGSNQFPTKKYSRKMRIAPSLTYFTYAFQIKLLSQEIYLFFDKVLFNTWFLTTLWLEL